MTGHRHIIFFLILLFIAFGLYRAIALAWCCDDAFISFRCAENLVEGNGLVYNPGERVEVYTNFLWTVIIAGSMYLWHDPVIFSQIAGILFYLMMVVIFIRLSFLTARNNETNSAIVIPVAAVMLLVHHEFHVYATSGLETSMATALVSLGFMLLLTESRRGALFLAGLVNVLAIMTRPDMALFWVAGILFLLLIRRRTKIDILYFVIPFIVIYIPYWLMKYAYYGYPFPNAYYAKSGGGAYYSQGLVYLWLYVKTYYPLLLIIPTVVYVAAVLLKAFVRKRRIDESHRQIWLLSLLYIMLYTFYVVRVGGDFMFARFLIPITPIYFFLLESILNRIPIRPAIRVLVSFILIVLVFLRWHQFDPPTTAISGIVDEHAAYPNELIEEARAEGALLKKYLDGLDVSAAFYGKKAMLVFYSDIRYAQEAAAGLTDEYIAHRPIKERGRPGHEKRMPFDYLIEKKINFILGGTRRPTDDPGQPEVISFDGVIAHIVIYENKIMNKLKKYDEVKFLDFPEFLDQYIEIMDSRSKAAIAGDLQFFRSYYFDHNDDPERLVKISGID